MPAIDFGRARDVLEKHFQDVEAQRLKATRPAAPQGTEKEFDLIFGSSTQAFREVLLGCALARLLNPEIEVRLPYVEQGDKAFSGRSLDENVVNPLLQELHIPASRGPYLSVFRRSVRLIPETREGIRDKAAYDALLTVLGNLQAEAKPNGIETFLRYVLYRFLELRDKADVRLHQLQRMSIEQYERLIRGLLETPSGGRFPVSVAAAAFSALSRCLGVQWTIAVQGINVADSATGAGGDIVVSKDEKTFLVIEVTEREIDQARMRTTFKTKIAPYGIEDYLFFYTRTGPSGEARDLARRYFAQGHEIAFVELERWIVSLLGALGSRCRSAFGADLHARLASRDFPAALKVAWNKLVEGLVSGPA